MAMWLTLCKKIDPEIRFTFNQKKNKDFWIILSLSKVPQKK